MGSKIAQKYSRIGAILTGVYDHETRFSMDHDHQTRPLNACPQKCGLAGSAEFEGQGPGGQDIRLGTMTFGEGTDGTTGREEGPRAWY